MGEWAEPCNVVGLILVYFSARPLRPAVAFFPTRFSMLLGQMCPLSARGRNSHPQGGNPSLVSATFRTRRGQPAAETLSTPSPRPKGAGEAWSTGALCAPNHTGAHSAPCTLRGQPCPSSPVGAVAERKLVFGQRGVIPCTACGPLRRRNLE